MSEDLKEEDQNNQKISRITKTLDENINIIPPSPSSVFLYHHDLDTNGIIYHLTKQDPLSVKVTCSSISVGLPKDFINREKVRCWTLNLPYSWFCVDLGENNLVIPSYYTLGYGSSGNACCPRYWILQGATTITRIEPQYGNNPNDTPENDPDWQTLSIHNNDTSIHTEWGVYSWKLNCKRPYRYFRIVQTGPNSFVTKNEDYWSHVLVANRFEIYGILIPFQSLTNFIKPSSNVVQTKFSLMENDKNLTTMILDLLPPPIPTKYGNSTNIPYSVPYLIRAEPSSYLLELFLLFFSRHNERNI